MDKSKLSEADICEKFTSPALVRAGWDVIEAKDNHHAVGAELRRLQAEAQGICVQLEASLGAAPGSRA